MPLNSKEARTMVAHHVGIDVPDHDDPTVKFKRRRRGGFTDYVWTYNTYNSAVPVRTGLLFERAPGDWELREDA